MHACMHCIAPTYARRPIPSSVYAELWPPRLGLAALCGVYVRAVPLARCAVCLRK